MEKETALKILRELHDNALFSERTALETLIPELKESEDEKVRKEIIEYLKQNVPHHHDDEVLKSREWIAWLEKQGERKPIEQKPAWSEEDEYQINTILHRLDLKREKYKNKGNQVEEKRYKTQYDWLRILKERMKRE